MGSLLLECPLCCSETFTCHDSLKYHLLSISDNLFCPECGERFEKIFDLAMHLGVHTNSSETCTSNVSTTEDAHLILLDVDVKQELTEAITSDGHSTLEELNTSTVEHITDVAETNKVEEYEDLYFCSSCRINFTSIQEHLEKFHNGHQVLLEDEDTLDNESNVIGDEDKETHNVETNESVIKPEGHHTVQEEECVDKNGRLYTRRVVKIEKFWDDSQIKPKIINGKRPSQIGNSNNIVDNLETDTNNSENIDEISEFLQCSKCDKKFLTLELYSNHKCSGASSSKTDLQKCSKCKGIFINSDYLKEHMKTHKNKASNTVNENVALPPFVCKVCKTEFATFKSLRLHMRMHLPVKSKIIEPPAPYGMHGEEIESVKSSLEMFVCKICNKPYNKQYEEAHVKFHSNESDFNCDICNRKFHTQENLTMHIRAHSDQKKFACSYCKKTFLTSDKLEAHLSTKCQKRRYECQYCGRRFARPHEKVKHERIHTGEKPHVCEICGKAFRVSYCLTLHLRTHSGTRPYKCNHCGKRFKAHSVYNHHLLTHSDDRKYKCPYCPKTFKTGVQLAGHKNSHTKPFTCTECNRPFASLYAVRSHMETHQRQNNLKYKCWICGASYARAFALRDHVKDQHVTERDTSVDVDAIILENYDYSLSDNMEADEVMLGDPEENMLIDIGSEVQDIGMPVVEIEPEAHT